MTGISEIKHLYRTIMFLLLLSAAIPAAAQQPHLKSISLPAADGSCLVKDMIQSDQGFLYLATTCGLMRYDGLDFEPAHPLIPQEAVNTVFQDGNGRIWAGYSSGSIVAFSGFSSELPMVIRQGGANEITGIAQDSAGRMWFAAYGRGICYLEGDSIRHIGSEEGLSDIYVYDIVADRHGHIWAGSDAGIDILRFYNGTLAVEHLDMDDGLPDMMIVSIDSDPGGSILAGGYNNGFCRIDSKTMQIQNLTGGWNYGPVSGMLDGTGYFWIATEESGLIRVEKNQNAMDACAGLNGINTGRLNGILRDMEGNIWTWGAGRLFLIPGEKFAFVFNGPDNHLKDVHALMIDDQQYIWYAAEKGLFRHTLSFSDGSESQKIPLPSAISSRDITCIFQDFSGRVWIGTFGRGLYRLEPDFLTGKLFTENDGLINNNVLSIDASGEDIWFATLGGASKFRDGRFENYDQTRGLGNNFIYSVLADKQGRIWFATDGTGITRLENGSFTNFGPHSGLKSEKVYDMAMDKQGRLWCATHDNGIFFFGNERFHEIPVLMEENPTISALETDDFNNLLIVHENGIDIYNTHSQTYHAYGRESGIYPIDPEFNSTARTEDGQIWIGTEKGLIRYRSAGRESRNLPKTVITGVSVFLEEADRTGHADFAHHQNQITFSYAGLWFQNPEQVKYRIMLEGNDQEWKNTGDRRAGYSNLPPGEYTFRVQAALSPEFHAASSAAYHFRIRSPYWAKWWFYVLVASLLALSARAFIRIREARMRRIEALEREKILFQYETLKSQVNPHFLFNSFSTLMNVIEENRTLALEYVEHLSVFFRNILEYRDKDLVRIDEELEVAENYIYLQKRRYGDTLMVEISIAENQKSSLIPPLTLQLLIENAIKHNVISASRPLKISIRSYEQQIRVTNSLQRKSFTGDSTGFGLKTIRHRYELFGKSEVSVRETNTHFIVSLPLIRRK